MKDNPRLRGLRDALAKLTEWDGGLDRGGYERVPRGAEPPDRADVAQPARVALTGRSASPGLFQVMFVLGKDAR